MADLVVEYDENKIPVIAYLEGSPAVYSTNGANGKKAGTTLTSVQPEKRVEGTFKWAPWGTNNMFPQDVYDMGKKNGVLISGLNLRAKAILGQGVYPCKIKDIDAQGRETVEMVKDPEITLFIKRSNFNYWQLEMSTNLVWFFNCFPELILSADHKKIVRMGINKSMDCRYERWNPQSRRVENCYVSKCWPSPNPEQYEKIPVIDVRNQFEEIERLKANDKLPDKYIFPVSYPTPSTNYYDLAHWDAVRQNGWLEVSNAIPSTKRAILKNQMVIKYHIKIPYTYWTTKYKDWNGKSDTDRNTIVTAVLTEMNNWLSGSENAGKTFISHFDVDKVSGKASAGWEIQVVDDKMKNDLYLPDSAVANSEILFNLQVDPSLFGAQMPGGVYSGGSGSGSDKRESFLILLALLAPERNLCMQPLEFAQMYNDWDPEIVWRTRDMVLTTLDKGKGTEKTLS